MTVPKFDVFRGVPGTADVLWIEAIEGLGAAKRRMDELACEQPGPYFVYYSCSHAVLASTNTTALRGLIERGLKVG